MIGNLEASKEVFRNKRIYDEEVPSSFTCLLYFFTYLRL
jgi:hypothetical protein